MLKYVTKLGLDPSSATFSDVFSFDPEMAAFVPHPVYSVMLLFPIGEKNGYLETRHKNDGQIENENMNQNLPWFTLQTVSNACGAIGVIHSIMNNLNNVKIVENSWFSKFATKTANLTQIERAATIYNDSELFTLHEEAANKSDIPIPDNVDTHFVTFTQVDGKLWELDGRKPRPICHGDVKDLLLDTLEVIQKEFLPHVSDPLKITMTALTACPQ
ncbi:Ubiquitin carboxyl-terminal hydrolase isozyme L3 [Tritrichomonas foetus]|uniref:Ubiquitin carboxyl-terminal hydrolase n=1 Tax=Tritrichomonas foetus TaxID=1144522 RepID=A0A1J4KBE4_9EUKA|nr:Ubiquitin carboxyl-terminal hydrolase isozyme L3 [Tritrichomonas foetus]|eukprot:OHT08735.1 Ubiquitin carboxyl-terminal hydrolase isozyme L3 [Tritrichomonas foetus]